MVLLARTREMPTTGPSAAGMATMLPMIPGLILLKPPMTRALSDTGCPPKASGMAF